MPVVDFLRKMIDVIRPKAQLRVSQEVQVSNREPTVRIGLVRVEGKIPPSSNTFDQGRSVAAKTTREEAMIFDLRLLDSVRLPRHCGSFLIGVEAGTNRARCHFVLNDRWLDELRPDSARRREWIYSDDDSAIAAAEADELRRYANMQRFAPLDLTRIILRGGLGQLQFGMTAEQVRGLMGDPDAVYKNDWEYEDIDLNLEFKPIPNRGLSLVKLWTENPRVRLLNIPLIGPGFDQTLSLLRQVGVKHEGTFVLKGIDWQDFEHGLTLDSLGDTVERVNWTIEDLIDDEDGEIDWSKATRVG